MKHKVMEDPITVGGNSKNDEETVQSKEMPRTSPKFKKINSCEHKFHTNVTRSSKEPVFAIHQQQDQPRAFFYEQLQFCTSIHECFLYPDSQDELSDTEELDCCYIVYNYQERMCLYHPISQRLHNHELRQLSCIDVYPKRQLMNRAEVLIGYLGGRIEIAKISHTFQCKEEWSCKGFGDVSQVSWVRTHSTWTSSTPREQKFKSQKQFLATFRLVPGVIFMYDRSIKSEALHDYLKTRSRTTRSKHRATLVGQSANPVQIWDITHCLITKMVWSPCGEFLAIGNEEGSLILLNWLTREKVAEFRSYFGAIIALAWSPDSKYLVSGGQDDFVYVWDIKAKSCLALGEGHTSWITDLDFESVKEPDQPYRFISTSRDTKIIFWTFLPTDFPPPVGPSPFVNISDCPKIESTNINQVLKEPISAAAWTRHFFMTSDISTFSVWRKSDDSTVLEALQNHSRRVKDTPRRRTRF